MATGTLCEQHMDAAVTGIILLNKGGSIEEIVSYHQPSYSTKYVMKKVWWRCDFLEPFCIIKRFCCE